MSLSPRSVAWLDRNMRTNKNVSRDVIPHRMWFSRSCEWKSREGSLNKAKLSHLDFSSILTSHQFAQFALSTKNFPRKKKKKRLASYQITCWVYQFFVLFYRESKLRLVHLRLEFISLPFAIVTQAIELCAFAAANFECAFLMAQIAFVTQISVARPPSMSQSITSISLHFRFTQHIYGNVTARRSICTVPAQRLLLIHTKHQRVKFIIGHGVEFARSFVIPWHTQSRRCQDAVESML